jgi:hypothetical protein
MRHAAPPRPACRSRSGWPRRTSVAKLDAAELAREAAAAKPAAPEKKGWLGRLLDRAISR